MLDYVLLPLLKLCGRTNRVFVSRAASAVESIINTVSAPLLLGKIIDSMSTSASRAVRFYCASFVFKILNIHHDKDLDITLLEKYLQSALADAAPETRACAAQAFRIYATQYPTSSERFLAGASLQLRRVLQIRSEPVDIQQRPSKIVTEDVAGRQGLGECVRIVKPTIIVAGVTTGAQRTTSIARGSLPVGTKPALAASMEVARTSLASSLSSMVSIADIMEMLKSGAWQKRMEGVDHLGKYCRVLMGGLPVSGAKLERALDMLVGCLNDVNGRVIMNVLNVFLDMIPEIQLQNDKAALVMVRSLENGMDFKQLGEKILRKATDGSQIILLVLQHNDFTSSARFRTAVVCNLEEMLDMLDAYKSPCICRLVVGRLGPIFLRGTDRLLAGHAEHILKTFATRYPKGYATVVHSFSSSERVILTRLANHGKEHGETLDNVEERVSSKENQQCPLEKVDAVCSVKDQSVQQSGSDESGSFVVSNSKKPLVFENEEDSDDIVIIRGLEEISMDFECDQTVVLEEPPALQ